MKIVIDGNIGVGKSTQLRLLEQVGYRVFREPIDDWSLDLFYKDQPRWALLLQMQILNSFQPGSTSSITIHERCPLSSNYVFWANLVRNQKVTQEEDSIYQKYYERLGWQPDLYIYLTCSPEEAHERIKIREQTGDTSVSLEYLQELHSLYTELAMKIPCVVIPINVSGRSAQQIHSEIISVLKLENELYVRNRSGEKVQKAGTSGRQMLCAPLPNMCNLS
jgi:deoxyadenosine/deoxycytidine kinase